MKDLALFSAIFFLSLFSCCAQKDSQLTEDKIDALFVHVTDETPGYAIGVVKDNKFLLEKNYGSANLEYKIPIGSHSAFNVASLSKQFTAACIALLMLENKISLEDEVAQFFADFPFADSQMKIKHLIYMTSGINDYYYNPRANKTDWSSLNYFDIDTAIQASFNSTELMYIPGSQWSYSNINYMLLTKIVEQVSELSFADFMEQRIFRPLGMTNSFVNDDIFQVIPNRAHGYNFRDAENTKRLREYGYLKTDRKGLLQINRNSPHYGGSGVFTTLNDFKKWVDNFESREFGGADFYNLMHKTLAFDHDKTNDAFGLVFGDFNGHEIVWYEGGDWGCSSYFIRFVKEGISIFCFSNLGTGNTRDYTHKIIDILVEDQIINFE